MRAYICPSCDHVLAIGSDGLEANACSHVASDGSTHTGQVLVELPGQDHMAGVAWHHDNPAATQSELLAVFPPRAYEPPTLTLLGNIHDDPALLDRLS